MTYGEFDVNHDGVTDMYGVDSNGDGLVDQYFYDPNQDGLIDAVGTDYNEDGYLDQPLIEPTHDQPANLTAHWGDPLNHGPDDMGYADVPQATDPAGAYAIGSGVATNDNVAHRWGEPNPYV